MSGEETATRLKELIAKFVLRYNYWGYLFSRIRRKPAKNFGSIMGVGAEFDGSITLFYEPDLVDGTQDDELIHIIEHEGMHVLNKHLARTLKIVADTPGGIQGFKTSGRAKIWNYAMDCSVNEQARIKDPIIIAGKPTNGCFPEKFDLPKGHAAEWYYSALLEKAKKVNVPSLGKGDGEGDGPSLYGSHEPWLDSAEGVSDVYSLSTKVSNHIADIVKESVKTFSKDRGTLPGHIQELIQEALAPPRVPYYQIIRKLVRGTRLSKFKRSFTKINRKRTYVFVLDKDDEVALPEISPFPGKTRDFTFKVVIIIDTSGSQSKEDIMEALSGIKSIIDNDKYCYTTVLEVDTQVQKEYEINKIRDIQFGIKGRGGTILRPGLERARQLNCDICLTFTDGGTDPINKYPRKILPKKNVFVIGERSGSSSQLVGAGYIVKVPGL